MNERRANRMNENRVYTFRPSPQTKTLMAKLLTLEPGDFGKRLAALRKAAGYTQQELADEVGATRRMIAYYETESDHPPTNMLVGLANALNVSTDELLGLGKKKNPKQPDTRLQRRLKQIEKMDASDKRQILQVIDAFIERAQLKQVTKRA